jgi:electron transfer flavoprotein beta subunit
MAEILGMPYVGYVSAVKLQDGSITLEKEYPGGLIGEFEMQLPGTLGIQAAEQPPRYVAVSKVRQAMKTATIEALEAGTLASEGGLPIGRMYQPEAAKRATMITGDEEEIADRLVEILREAGAL